MTTNNAYGIVTVQDLIDELNKVRDKQQTIRFKVNYWEYQMVDVPTSNNRNDEDFDILSTEVEVVIKDNLDLDGIHEENGETYLCLSK